MGRVIGKIPHFYPLWGAYWFANVRDGHYVGCAISAVLLGGCGVNEDLLPNLVMVAIQLNQRFGKSLACVGTSFVLRRLELDLGLNM